MKRQSVLSLDPNINNAQRGKSDPIFPSCQKKKGGGRACFTFLISTWYNPLLKSGIQPILDAWMIKDCKFSKFCSLAYGISNDLALDWPKC